MSDLLPGSWAVTLTNASSRYTASAGVSSIILMMSGILLSCFTICSTTCGAPCMVMVILETFSFSVPPTVMVAMLKPLLLISEVTLKRTPGRSSTIADIICRSSSIPNDLLQPLAWGNHWQNLFVGGYGYVYDYRYLGLETPPYGGLEFLVGL